jgi:hypothetical protein
MNSRTPLLVAAAAGIVCALPAAAGTDAFRTGAAYAPVAEADMADLRGKAAPSSKVFIQVGNTTYSDVQNGNPSSATVVVAGNTAVTGHAAVGGSTVKPVVIAPTLINRTVTVSYKISH